MKITRVKSALDGASWRTAQRIAAESSLHSKIVTRHYTNLRDKHARGTIAYEFYEYYLNKVSEALTEGGVA